MKRVPEARSAFQIRKEDEMFELKPLSKDAVAGALAKAERYRLLNEAEEAESICLDVLAIEPGNQSAVTMLVLAITDQFRDDVSGNVARAQALLPRLEDEYSRAYFAGIIHERRAKAGLHQRGLEPRTGIYDCLTSAMHEFERAANVRPVGNDDAILRWNACARTLMRYPRLQAQPDEETHAIMSE
jgi:hypothetical protein